MDDEFCNSHLFWPTKMEDNVARCIHFSFSICGRFSHIFSLHIRIIMKDIIIEVKRKRPALLLGGTDVEWIYTTKAQVLKHGVDSIIKERLGWKTYEHKLSQPINLTPEAAQDQPIVKD